MCKGRRHICCAARSPTNLESTMLVPSFAKLGSLLLLRGFAQVGFASLMAGILRVGPVFPLSVADSTTAGPSLSTRSLAQLGLSAFVLTYAALGSLLPLRSPSKTETLAAMPGLSRVGPVFKLPVTDSVRLGLSMPPRSPACLSSSTSVSGASHLDSLLLLQQYLWTGLSASTLGMTKSGIMSLALDFSRPGALPALRSHARPGVVPFVSGCAEPELLMLPRNAMQSDSLVSLFGLSRCGPVFFLPVIDTASPDLSSSSRSLAQVDAPMSALDFHHASSFSSLRGSARVGLAALPFGLARAGLAFSLFLVEMAQPGLPTSSHSFACPGPACSAQSFASCGPPPPSHSLGHLGLVPAISGSTRLGLVLLVTDFAKTGLPLSIRAPACSGLLPSMANFCQAGPPMPVHSLLRMDSLIPSPGMSRADFVFSLSVVSHALSGLPPLLHSSSRAESPALALNHARSGVSMPLQSNIWPGFILPAFGLSRTGSVSPLLVVDSLHLGSLLLARTLACLEVLSLLLDYLQMDLLPLPQSLHHPGFSTSTFGRMCPGATSPSADSISCGPASLPHSPSQLGVVASAFNFGHPGLPLLLRATSCLEAPVSALGLSWAGFVSLLLVVDAARLEVPPLSQTPAHLDLCVSTPDSSKAGSPLPARSSGRLGLMALVLDFVKQDLPLLIRSLSRTEVSVLPCGLARLGETVPVPGCTTAGLLAPVRSLVHPGSTLPPLNAMHVGVPLSLRSPGHPEASALLLGISRTGFVFALLVTDKMQSESLLPPHSFACSSPATLVSDGVNLGSTLLTRGHVRFGPTSFPLGVAKSDYAYSLLVLETAIFASSPPVHSSVWLGFPLPVLGLTNLGSTMPPQSCAYLGSALPASSTASPGLGTLVFDFSHPESLLLLQSHSQLGSAASVSSFAHLDLLTSLRSSSCLGPMASASGLTCAGFVSLLSAADTTTPGTSTLLRSLAKSGLAAPALGSGHMGSPLPPQAPS